MRKIIAIAKCLLRLLFRAGTGWGIILAAAGIAFFIFFAAKGDSVLINEMQIRSRYGLVFSVVFLSFSMLFLACTAMRRDIDEKLMHMLTAYPIRRWQIWTGKLTGLLVFSLLSLGAIFLSLGLASAAFMRNWPDAEEKVETKQQLSRALKLCRPVQDDIDAEALKVFRSRIDAGMIPDGTNELEARREIARELRRDRQLVAPGETREWIFELGKVPRLNEKLSLEYTIYAENRRELIRGTWKLEALDEPQSATRSVAALPYVKGHAHFPLEVVPVSGRMRLTFTGEEAPYLVFPVHRGALLLYDNGSVWGNLLRLTFILLLHFTAVIAIGLVTGTVFTLPVAAFVSLMMYLVAVSADFFQSVVTELDWAGDSLPVVVSRAFLQAGLWISTGLRLPPVINDFSEGISIPFIGLWQELGSGFLLYLALIVSVGIYWFNRKELDRLH